METLKPHKQGVFCWAELGTTDTAAAKAFYGSLMGWSAFEIPMGPNSVYTKFQMEGKDAAAMYQLTPEHLAGGVPPNWLPYASVDDVRASAAKVAELGGKVIVGPLDVGESGSMAVIQDPQGATLGLYQANKEIGNQVVDGRPGSQCWTELMTTSAEASKAFYGALLGYSFKASKVDGVDYTELQIDGQSVGGMMQMGPEFGTMPPHWMIYFSVANADATAEQGKAQGGTVCVPPSDIPGVGRFAVMQDGQGAFFSILKVGAGAAA
jgi:uncharacterized protein